MPFEPTHLLICILHFPASLLQFLALLISIGINQTLETQTKFSLWKILHWTFDIEYLKAKLATENKTEISLLVSDWRCVRAPQNKMHLCAYEQPTYRPFSPILNPLCQLMPCWWIYRRHSHWKPLSHLLLISIRPMFWFPFPLSLLRENRKFGFQFKSNDFVFWWVWMLLLVAHSVVGDGGRLPQKKRRPSTILSPREGWSFWSENVR